MDTGRAVAGPRAARRARARERRGLRVACARRRRTERRTARSTTLAGRAARGPGNSSATARMSRIGAAAFGVSAMSANATTAASPTAIRAPQEDSRRRCPDDAPGAVVAGAGIGGVATATDVRLVARSSPTKACMACSYSCWRPTGSASTRLPVGLVHSRPDSAPTTAAREVRGPTTAAREVRGRSAAGARGPIGSVVTHGRRRNAHYPPRAPPTWRKHAHAAASPELASARVSHRGVMQTSPRRRRLAWIRALRFYEAATAPVRRKMA